MENVSEHPVAHGCADILVSDLTGIRVEIFSGRVGSSQGHVRKVVDLANPRSNRRPESVIGYAGTAVHHQRHSRRFADLSDPFEIEMRLCFIDAVSGPESRCQCIDAGTLYKITRFVRPGIKAFLVVF